MGRAIAAHENAVFADEVVVKHHEFAMLHRLGRGRVTKNVRAKRRHVSLVRARLRRPL